MRMARVSKTTTISLPPRLFREALSMAQVKGMTTSELFREAFRRYQREERTWRALRLYGRRQAEKAGIRTAADVERLIDASRR